MSLAIATHPETHSASYPATGQRKTGTYGRRWAYATMTILSGMVPPVAWAQHAVLASEKPTVVYVGLSAAELLMLVLLITASYTDMRWRKIYNWSIYPVLAWSAVIACLHSLGVHFGLPQGLPTAELGALGMTGFVMGTVGCGLIMLIPYRMSHGGAGDVKLAMALGGLLGFLPAIVALACGYILAASYILVAPLVHADTRPLIRTLARTVGHRYVHASIAPPSAARAAALQQPVPLAGFFAMGVVISQCI